MRQILVTDSPAERRRGADVVVWLGAGEPPAALSGGLVLEPSSRRTAAVYIAAVPAEVRLSLNDPVGFAELLADVRAASALRAA